MPGKFGEIAMSESLDVGGTMLNSRLAESRQHDAQDFSAGQFANRYQVQVRDLKAAGLNPMLAYMSGAGSAPQSSAASASGTDSGRIYNESRLVSAQEANLTASAQNQVAQSIKAEAERRNVDADTLIKQYGIPPLLAAQASAAISSAAQADAMAQKISMEIPKIKTEIAELESRISKNKSDVEANNSLITANAVLSGLRALQGYLANAEARHTNLGADILEPKAKAAKTTTGELAATAENVGKIGSAVSEWRDALMGKPKGVFKYESKYPKKAGD